jgi:ribosomal protein S18 acetylase RimI-like enzyme
MTTATFCKRFRMEIDLRARPEAAALPPGFVWVPWEKELLETHARVKWLSFEQQLDTTIFPKLASLAGCIELMNTIHERPGFAAPATWLIGRRERFCGTIQGIRDPDDVGAIQNIGVVPEWRGAGLGKALLMKALEGFFKLGCKRVFLEVTARNQRALRLYLGLGFSIRKTVYREVPTSQDWYSI